MKYTFFFFLIFTFSFTRISAQQDHFLYFQTETNQAFYVKLEDKIFSSTSSGYLIMPKLKEGSYKLIFGFPKNEWPEEVINYTLEKDAGFLLKNFSEKGWGLFDLQSLNVIMPGEKLAGNTTNNTNNNTNKIEEVKKDNFSEMLATVVNDSTIKQQDIAVQDEVNKTPKEKAVENIEPVTPAKDISQKTDTSVQILYSLITKNLQVKSKDGMEMIYIDEYNNDKDTIKIFMPEEGDKEKNEDKQPEAIKINTQADTGKNIEDQLMINQAPVKTKTEDSSTMVAETTKGIAKEQKSDTLVTIADTTKSIAKEDKIEFLPPKSGMINSNCRQYATEDDFLKLRKKMAAENDDDNMITTAKKVLRSKCFTTKDIKNLSTLFLNDQGKYNFFDAAYPYVSDSDIYYTLENQLSDEYYIKRFKVMIHR